MARTAATERVDTRASALWGTGGRGGDHRSNALWGRAGRGLLATALGIVIVALAVPLASAADGKSGKSYAAEYVAPGLLEGAERKPDSSVRVIISSPDGANRAEGEFERVVRNGSGYGQLKGRLDLVDAIAVELKASLLKRLANVPGLVIVPDSPVRVAEDGVNEWNRHLWPYESGSSRLWTEDVGVYASKTPTIAIVDSGVEPGRLDYRARLVASVKLTSLEDGDGDTRGHGTFVAGIAAGSAPGFTGAAPAAKILSIDVMNARGMALTSDVVRACDWILANKDTYKIRVANFSLHSSYAGSLRWSPLNRAVEKLWFSGVVVVAAAGNYGRPDGPSGVPHAPGNDPFVITVGAADIGGTATSWDDSVAYWSAYGYTPDGFAKPDVVAAGRYMVGPVPESSTLARERPENVVAPGYIQLSGTSFAAPVVSGTVAQMLARHPGWTPDQVKGALMLTARRVGAAAPLQAGVGQVTATRAAGAWFSSPPNPNRALNQFVVPDPKGGPIPVFDATAWANAVRNDPSWARSAFSDAAWASASWDSAAWADAAWADTSFNDAAWADAAWADAGWEDAGWGDSSYEDVAEGDVNAEGGYAMTPAAEAELAEDSDL